MVEGRPSRAAETKKKLTAVFVTEGMGYSHLMGDDHDAAFKTLAEYREIFLSYLQHFNGRVVNAPGDSNREISVDWKAAPNNILERMNQPIGSGKRPHREALK